MHVSNEGKISNLLTCAIFLALVIFRVYAQLCYKAWRAVVKQAGCVIVDMYGFS